MVRTVDVYYKNCKIFIREQNVNSLKSCNFSPEQNCHTDLHIRKLFIHSYAYTEYEYCLTCSIFGYGLLLVGVAPVMVFLLCKTGLGFKGYILIVPSKGLSGVSLSLLLLKSGSSCGSATGGNLKKIKIIILLIVSPIASNISLTYFKAGSCGRS